MANDATDLTQYPIGSTSFVPAARNASDFDKIVNADVDTVTNRAGNEIKTLKYIDTATTEVEDAKDQALIDITAEVTETESAKDQALIDISADVTTVDNAKDQALIDIQEDIDEVQEIADTAQGLVDISTAEAAASAAAAAESEINAEASAQAAASSATIVGSWEDATGAGTAFTSYTYQGNSVWMLAVDVADITSTEPNSGNSDWIIVSRPFEAAPYPDLHIPFNDGLRIESGYGTYDQIDVSAAQDGSIMVDLPSKSVSFSRSSTANNMSKWAEKEELPANYPAIASYGIWAHQSFTNTFTYSEFDGGYPIASGTQWASTTEVNGITFGEFTSVSSSSKDFTYTADSNLSFSVFVYGFSGSQRIRTQSLGVTNTVCDIYVDLSDGSATENTIGSGWSYFIEKICNGIYRVHHLYDASIDTYGNTTFRAVVYPMLDSSPSYYGGFQIVVGEYSVLPYKETTSTSETVSETVIFAEIENNMPAIGMPFTVHAKWATDFGKITNCHLVYIADYLEIRSSNEGSSLRIVVGDSGGLFSRDFTFETIDVAVTFDGLNVQVYIDKELIGEFQTTVTGTTYTDNEITIGYGVAQRQSTKVKDLKIYHQHMSSAQVSALG